AFVSSRGGHRQVYVQSYPALDNERWISTGGGAQPHWSADGRELFYRNGDWLMVVSVAPAAASPFGAPHGLFHGPFEGYDVAPDGRFLMIQPMPSAGLQEFHLVRSWA